MSIYNDLPGVRRYEEDKSDYMAVRTGNTVGVVVTSPYGRIKRPYVVGSQSEYVSKFGAPEVILNTNLTSNANLPNVFAPEYGYNQYAALYALEETSSVAVVRDYNTASDKYAGATLSGISNPGKIDLSASSATTYYVQTSTPMSATPFVEGDPYDTDTFISSIDNYNYSTNSGVFGAVAPGDWGNSIAVTIEYPSSTSSWIYAYDDYPVSALSAYCNGTGALTASGVLPIARKMCKLSVYTKDTKISWDELYANNSDLTGKKYRIQPKESYMVSFINGVMINGESVFIDDVINGTSSLIYTNFTGSGTPEANLFNMNTNNVAPQYDDSGYFVSSKFFIYLSGGNYTKPTITASGTVGNASSYNILKNRKELALDFVAEASWNPSAKSLAAGVANSRRDCFVELQAHAPSVATVDKIIQGETYSYEAPSYIGLNVGYSKVYDQFSKQNIYLPNSIFTLKADLRTLRIGKPWDAVAGVERGRFPVLGQLKIYTDPELDRLIGRNFNPVSFERGYGFCLWSQRTAQLKKSSTDRKNVRFNLNYIEANIEAMLKQFVFQNNTPQLRQRITMIVDGFLRNVMNAGGLYAYVVKCDASNNTPEIIDAKMLNVNIGVQPTQTAEIINYTTTIANTGVSFTSVGL